MIELGRQQMIALGIAFALVVGCGMMTALAVMARSDAWQELEDRRAQLSRLKAAHARQMPATAAGSASAPDAAFVGASTAAIAGAQVQTHLARLVAARNASLISSGILTSARGDAADAIRLQVSFDMGWAGLQSVLYELETSVPYIFVDALSVQPRGAQPGGGDPLLHVTLSVRTLWRRTSI